MEGASSTIYIEFLYMSWDDPISFSFLDTMQPSTLHFELADPVRGVTGDISAPSASLSEPRDFDVAEAHARVSSYISNIFLVRTRFSWSSERNLLATLPASRMLDIRFIPIERPHYSAAVSYKASQKLVLHMELSSRGQKDRTQIILEERK